MGRAVVEKLGLNAQNIDKIQDIPYQELLAAATDAIVEQNPNNFMYRWYGAGLWFSPVLDGEVIPYPLEDPRVAELSKGLPTIIGCNFSENNMLPAVYANADMRYKMGDTKQYLYIFAKPSPHMDGTFATNHCTEMPFVFNNIWLGRFMVGADKSAYKLADFMSDVWVSFAKDGVPDTNNGRYGYTIPEEFQGYVFIPKELFCRHQQWSKPVFDEGKDPEFTAVGFNVYSDIAALYEVKILDMYTAEELPEYVAKPTPEPTNTPEPTPTKEPGEPTAKVAEPTEKQPEQGKTGKAGKGCGGFIAGTAGTTGTAGTAAWCVAILAAACAILIAKRREK